MSCTQFHSIKLFILRPLIPKEREVEPPSPMHRALCRGIYAIPLRALAFA
jgi:hypothetical protein